MIYRLLFNLFLRRIDVEYAHRLASRSLRLVTAVPGAKLVLRALCVPHDPAIEVHALGMTFPSPLGVAAGVDKDATWFESLGLVGFGFVEVGTVTAERQEGNPHPRVFRIAEDRALLNKMGFPNPGAKAVAKRLAKRSHKVIVGVNVGKSMAAPLDQAGADYRATVREVARVCDYIVVNVSSPNTPGLRAMQSVELLRPLIAEVRSELDAAKVKPPMLIKIGPDAEREQIRAVAELALELSLDGIVAVNTTMDRSGLSDPSEEVTAVEGGGISGAPLKARSLQVLRQLYSIVGDRLVLISVGGVADPDDAWERILAGATLIQAYTGLIYGGPAWPWRMNRDLARRAREAGVKSIQDLVGSEGGNGQAAAILNCDELGLAVDAGGPVGVRVAGVAR